MSEDDDNAGGGDRRTPQVKDASALPKHLGAKLRTLFTDAEAQPVPERLRELLEELAAREKKTD